MEQDIRWKQRFQNYNKAVEQLIEFKQINSMNKFEVQGLIQCFEYTFELAWKTMKDFLEEQGLEANSPRSSIQQAFATGLIENGATWIDALNKRNLMAHTYDENVAEEAKHLILESYSAVLIGFRDQLRNQL